MVMRQRLCVALIALSGCKAVTFDKSGLRCEAGKCLAGYDCHPERNVCVPQLNRSCDGSGVCPADVRTGDACSADGAFLPCGPVDDCSRGCRTCSGGAWSECTGGQCTPTGPESCDGDDNDCSGEVDDVSDLDVDCDAQAGGDVHVALWSCAAGACGVAACDAGWIDRSAGAGCETPCTVSNGGIEVCDGADNDCDGTPDDAVDANAECGARFGAAMHVTAWSCTSGDCAIFACEAGWTDRDGLQATGCETSCIPSNGGTESCDGEDNDCNGTVDDVRQGNLDAACATAHPSAVAVDAWACRSGACEVGLCMADAWDDDGVADNGCEYDCVASGAESCNGNDDDCDADTDTADGDLDEPAELDADCDAQHPSAVAVAEWSCAAACGVASCEVDTFDIDGEAASGCEYACTANGSEVCDGDDNDCDGTTDSGTDLAGCTTFYRDDDGDGIGRPDDALCLCGPEAPYDSTQPGDCTDDGTNLGIVDCTDYHLDADGDGYGVDGEWRCLCAPSGSYSAEAAGDCDDDAAACGASCNPGIAAETCNDGWDNDCSGAPDEGCSIFTVLARSNSNLVNNDVSAMALDANGNLWVGTRGAGQVSYLAAGATSFETVNGLKASGITSIVTDAVGNAWIGYDEPSCDATVACECGPSRVAADRATAVPRCTDAMSGASNGVTAMARDAANGDIYLGTPDDYAIYKATQNAIECDIEIGTGAAGLVRTLTVAGATLWLGSREQLMECTPAHTGAGVCNDSCTARPAMFAGTLDEVSGIVFDDGGTPGGGLNAFDDLLWVGSAGKGLASYELLFGGLTSYTAAGGDLPADTVQAVAVESGIAVYVGTTNGLAYHDQNAGSWALYATADGLPSNNIRVLIADVARNRLWIGTDQGVAYTPLF